MRVLFLTQYGLLAASSRTRVFQYLPLLAQHGFRCRVLTILPDRAIGGSQILVTQRHWRKLSYYAWASWRTAAMGLLFWWLASRSDLLFIQKVILPAPLRWLLVRRRKPLLYDFDDAIFTTEVRGGSWLARWKQRRNAAGLPGMLRLAQAAVVENAYTGAYAARFCPTVQITGPIDTAGHRPAATRPPRPEVVLGWIGSATTLPYLLAITAPLQRLCGRHPEVRLHIVGADQVVLDGVPVRLFPWQLDTEVAALQECDIGLMPLPDDPWTRGKGGYKLLQYMAVGLPVVASPVGINREMVRDGENGFLATTDGEWEDRLEELIADPARRRRLGQCGRELVTARYSLVCAADALAAAMRRAMQNAGGRGAE